MTIKPEDWLRHPFRLFDVEDLMVLSLLGEELPLPEIGKALGYTTANIAHRKRKYKSHWPDFDCIGTKGSSKYKLNPTAKRICGIATESLSILKKIE